VTPPSDTWRLRADENLVAAFDLVRVHVGHSAGGRRRFGAVEAIVSGLEPAFYNPVIAVVSSCRLEDVLAAIDWVEASGKPPSVHVAGDLDESIRPGLLAAAWVPDPWPTPVMATDLSAATGAIGATTTAAPTPASTDARIRVGGAELYEDWHAALESGSTFRQVFPRSLAADPAVRLAVADLDGEPVAAAAAIRSGSTLGIYAVGTLERARRRGIGRATTQAVMDAGRASWGSDLAILQSSDMGVPVYRSMGFVEVGQLVEYERIRT
jgi:GNAT superfamily N-acetyltransferase